MKSKTNYALKQSIIHASNWKKKLLEVLKGIKRIKPFILLSPPPPPPPMLLAREDAMNTEIFIEVYGP